MQLAAPTLPERQTAFRELAASDDPGAVTLLIEAARANEAWRIRQEVVRKLGDRARPGAGEALATILMGDVRPRCGPRRRPLGKLGDATARDALTRASATDASLAVRSAANGALARIR